MELIEIQYYLHLCACGCSGQIEIKKHHKYYGIPKFIKGHHFTGKNHTEETRKKQSEAGKIKKFTKEHRQNMSKASKGRKKSEEHKLKIGNSNKISLSKGQFSGEKNPMYGKHHTEEVRNKIREGRKGKYIGENSANWQGGKSFEEYPQEFNKDLKNQILERDNYTCQNPNCKNTYYRRLDTHHIDYDKQNNNLENLIILCINCHLITNGKNNRIYWTGFYQNIMERNYEFCSDYY